MAYLLVQYTMLGLFVAAWSWSMEFLLARDSLA